MSWRQTCEQCGDAYYTSHRSQMYCSRECKYAAMTARTVRKHQTEFIAASEGQSCYDWPFAKYKSGYGDINTAHGRTLAHRACWEYFHGEIPADLIIRHNCDRPSCINIHHLEIGTHIDNVNDMLSRDRAPNGERSGRARLTDAQVLAIRASSLPYPKLAMLYNVSRANIYAIKSRQTWKHI